MPVTQTSGEQRWDFPVEHLANQAAAYQRVLRRIKRKTPIATHRWYPHDTLGELYLLTELLEGEDRHIGGLLSQGPVLDLCCGDGDLAFFLASQGYTVDAVDWPRTNFNQMAGVRTMRQALESNMRIAEINLDGAFSLPRQFYNVIFFMGALYHLKHPFAVLEQLAASCAYCVLTTRVARLATDRQIDIAELPVAYLVDSLETNKDATNYWIFTPAGLRRALARTGWRISSMMTRGASRSDPASARGDERAYCFLRSARHHTEYLEGVYPPEFDEWRWTARRFSLRNWHVPEGAETVMVPLFLPDESLSILGPVTVSASIDGAFLPQLVLCQSGCHEFPIPANLLNRGGTRIEFELDRALPPDASDQRERGIVIRCVGPDGA